MSSRKKQQTNTVVVDSYLLDLHLEIKDKLISCLSDLSLPNDALHKKALSLTLLGIASVVADDTGSCDEDQFLELAQAAYQDAQLAIMQADRPQVKRSSLLN
jgi:hypothetical protein